MNIRTDVFSDADLGKQWADWKDKSGLDKWGAPKTWQQVQQVTKFLKGKKVKGKEVFGFLDQPKPWGGFQFYFTGSRASAYAKYPGEKNWMFDENMKPLVNKPAFVRAIQDIVDALPFEPADQINADPGTTAFQQFLTGTGSLLEWWGTSAQSPRRATRRRSATNSPSTSCRPRTTFTISARTQWEKLPSGPNVAPNMAYLGWGIYVMKSVDGDAKRHKAAWSAAAHLGGKDLVDVDGGLSVRLPAVPQEPHESRSVGARRLRQEIHRARTWTRSRRPTTTRTRRSSPASPASSSTTASPRMNWRKVFAGKETAQQGADNVAAAWDKLTDKLGRENQVKYYRIAMGI